MFQFGIWSSLALIALLIYRQIVTFREGNSITQTTLLVSETYFSWNSSGSTVGDKCASGPALAVKSYGYDRWPAKEVRFVRIHEPGWVDAIMAECAVEVGGYNERTRRDKKS